MQQPTVIGVEGRRLVANRWDLAAAPLVLAALVLIALGVRHMSVPLAAVEGRAVSLDPRSLPLYGLLTALRMLAALAVSLVFTFTYATLAAKSRRAELILIPVLDILQSVPILGFISFTVVFFLGLFPGSALGAECAAVFAIFTSQAWNMAFSLYQALKTVPDDLDEVTRGYRFSGWHRFWRLEVPFAMPGLVWNMMLSMSGGWFFVVASEAVTVGSTTFSLPGIGSYLAAAIAARNLAAVGFAVLAMLVVILIYDQLLFRPLLAWADRFRLEQTPSDVLGRPWVMRLAQRTRLLSGAVRPLLEGARWSYGLHLPRPRRRRLLGALPSRTVDLLWKLAIGLLAALGAWIVARYVRSELGPGDILTAFGLGLLTLARVAVLMVLASLLWVPVGVLIGLRPRLASAIRPLVQFLASFPANLLFPVVVVAIVRFRLDPDIWLSPLMILGTQWYILFNVIAGAGLFPQDLRDAASNLGLSGWTWWRKAMLPAVFPYYITGAVTAAGGSWNASIVAELVRWGSTRLEAHGLGAYIARASAAGDFPRIILGVAVMATFVTLTNRLVWRPLYLYAEQRLRLA
jgi:NitT/TauT family transport system permease protein